MNTQEYFFTCPEHGEFPDEFYECPVCESIDRDIDHALEDKKLNQKGGLI